MVKYCRYVFDTNVIVSALLIKDSTARLAFNEARERGMILLSFDVIQELHEVLHRPAFERYVSEYERLQFLTTLIRESLLVEIQQQIQECRDPRDDKFIELAVNGGANLIITGDADLRVINYYGEIVILSPREFLDSELY